MVLKPQPAARSPQPAARKCSSCIAAWLVHDLGWLIRCSVLQLPRGVPAGELDLRPGIALADDDDTENVFHCITAVNAGRQRACGRRTGRPM